MTGAITGDLYQMMSKSSNPNSTTNFKGFSSFSSYNKKKEENNSLQNNQSVERSEETKNINNVHTPKYTEEEKGNYLGSLEDEIKMWRGEDYTFSPDEENTIKGLLELSPYSAEETLSRYLTSKGIADKTGYSLSSIYTNLDDISSYYTGSDYTSHKKTFLEKIQAGFDNKELMDLQYQWMRADQMGDTEKRDKLEEKIKALEEKVNGEPSSVPQSFYDKVSTTVLGNIGYMAEPTLQGGTVGAAVGGTIALLSSMLNPISAAAVLGSAAIFASAGMAGRMALSYSNMTSGETYYEMMHNDKGEYIGGDKNLASLYSSLNGAFVGFTETMLDGTTSRLANTVGKTLGFDSAKFGANMLLKGVRGGVNKLGKISLDIATNVFDEAVFNEGVQSLFEDGMNALYEAGMGYEQSKDFASVVKDAAESALMGGISALIYGSVLEVPQSILNNSEYTKTMINKLNSSYSYTDFMESTDEMKPEDMSEGDYDKMRKEVYRRYTEELKDYKREGTVLENSSLYENEGYVDEGDAEAMESKVYRKSDSSLYSEIDPQSTEDNKRVYFGNAETGEKYGYVGVKTDGDVLTVTELRVKYGGENIREEMFRNAINEVRTTETEVKFEPKTKGLQSVKENLLKDDSTLLFDKDLNSSFSVNEYKNVRDKIKSLSPKMTDGEVNVASALYSILDKDSTLSSKNNGKKVESVETLNTSSDKYRTIRGVTDLSNSLIYLGKESNISTFTHEMFHAVSVVNEKESVNLSNAIRDTLDNIDERKKLEKWIEDHAEVYGSNFSKENIFKALETIQHGMKGQDWGVSAEEVLARTYEGYRADRSNIRPSLPEKIKSILRRLSDGIKRVYRSLKDNVKLNENISSSFDRLMGLDNSSPRNSNKVYRNAKKEEYIASHYTALSDKYEKKNFISSDGKYTGEVEVYNKRKPYQSEIDISLFLKDKGVETILLSEEGMEGEKHPDALLKLPNGEKAISEFKFLMGNVHTIADEIKKAANKTQSDIIVVGLHGSAVDLNVDELVQRINYKIDMGNFKNEFKYIFILRNQNIGILKKMVGATGHVTALHNSTLHDLYLSVNDDLLFDKAQNKTFKKISVNNEEISKDDLIRLQKKYKDSFSHSLNKQYATKKDTSVIKNIIYDYPMHSIVDGIYMLDGLKNNAHDMPFEVEYITAKITRLITGEDLILLPRYMDNMLNKIIGEERFNNYSLSDGISALSKSGITYEFKQVGKRHLNKYTQKAIEKADVGIIITTSDLGQIENALKSEKGILYIVSINDDGKFNNVYTNKITSTEVEGYLKPSSNNEESITQIAMSRLDLTQGSNLKLSNIIAEELSLVKSNDQKIMDYNIYMGKERETEVPLDVSSSDTEFYEKDKKEGESEVEFEKRQSKESKTIDSPYSETWESFIDTTSPDISYTGTESEKDRTFLSAIKDDEKLKSYLKILGEAELLNTTERNAEVSINEDGVNEYEITPYSDQEYREGLKERIEEKGINPTVLNIAKEIAKGEENLDIEEKKSVQSKYERTGKELRKLKESSARLSSEELELFRKGSKTLDKGVRERLSDVLRKEYEYKRDSNSYRYGILNNSEKFGVKQNSSKAFYDSFSLNKPYIRNNNCVDLHDNYDNCENFLSGSYLSGFSIEDGDNLISVFNNEGEERRGFIKEIAPFVKENIARLDNYEIKKVGGRNLTELYSTAFDFVKVAEVKYNSEYDTQNVGKDYDNPNVTLMVNPKYVKENFDLNSLDVKNFKNYDEAVEYQKSLIDYDKFNNRESKTYTQEKDDNAKSYQKGFIIDKKGNEDVNSNYERTNGFRELQREYKEKFDISAQYISGENGRITPEVRERLRRTYELELQSYRSRGNNAYRSLLNNKTGKNIDILEEVEPSLFHDILELNKLVMPFTEWVDLHDDYSGYNCYISSDGLSGFAINNKDDIGNLVSVFNLNDERGFVQTVAPLMLEKGATHLDCFNSSLQPLKRIYENVLGFKEVSSLEYNGAMDEAHIEKKYNEEPNVSFMVMTEGNRKVIDFSKNEYDKAKSYQESFLVKNDISDKLNNARNIIYSGDNLRSFRNLMATLTHDEGMAVKGKEVGLGLRNNEDGLSSISEKIDEVVSLYSDAGINKTREEVLNNKIGENEDYDKIRENSKELEKNIKKSEGDISLLEEKINEIKNGNTSLLFDKGINNDIKSNYERTDEFRRIQEESRRVSDTDAQLYHSESKTLDEGVRSRLSGVFRRQLESFYSKRSNDSRLLECRNEKYNTTFNLYQNVNGDLFHDIFEINRIYLPNGELVDLHDNYNNAKCYITDDGLSGFAIEGDGNLISVFNLNEKRGFLRSISQLVKEKSIMLDCFKSPKQDLEEIYKKVFSFKTASTMDYNMEYDHDDIASNHNTPQVAFMVNTEKEVITKHFNKEQYDEAKEYQESFITTKALFQEGEDAEEKINSLLNSEELKSGINKEVVIGSVGEAFSKNAKEHGLDIEGYKHTLDTSFINHVFKRHGDQKKEEERGSVAVTKEDIKNIPSILQSPDYIIYGGTTNLKKEAIIYAKKQDEVNVFVEEIWTGKKKLASKTLYKVKGTPDAISIKDNPQHYVQTFTDNMQIIDVKKEIVNSGVNSNIPSDDAPSFQNNSEKFGLKQNGSKTNISPKSLIMKYEREIGKLQEKVGKWKNKLKEYKAVQKERELKRRLASVIMNPVNLNTTDYETSFSSVSAIQALVDPAFRRNWVYSISNNLEGKTKENGGETMTIEEAKSYLKDCPADERYIIENSISPDTLSRLLDERKPLNDWTLGELKQMAEEVQELKREGKEALTLRRTALRDKASSINEYTIEKNKGKKNKKENTLPGSTEDKKNRKRVTLYFTRRAREWAQLLDGGYGEKGKNYKLLITDEVKHKNDFLRSYRLRSEKIDMLLEDKNTQKALLSKSTLSFRNPISGSVITNTYTGSELLTVYLSQFNEDNKEAVAFGSLMTDEEKGTVLSTIMTDKGPVHNYVENGEVIEDDDLFYETGMERYNTLLSLSEDFIKKNDLSSLVFAIREDLNSEENFSRLNKAMIEYFNRPLVRVNDYLPIRRTDLTGESLTDTLSDSMYNLNTGRDGKKGTEKGFTKERVKIAPRHQRSVELDLMKVYSESVRNQEYFIAFQGYVQELNRTYNSNNSKEMINDINRVYGPELMKEVQSYINTVSNPFQSGKKSGTEKFLKALRGHTAVAYLSWKLSSVVLQAVTSPFPGLSELGPAYFIKGYATYFSNGKNMNDFVYEKSEIMRARSMDMMTEELKERLSKSEKGKFSTLIDRMGKVGMMGLEAVDKVAVNGSWMGMYLKEMDKMKDDSSLTTTEKEEKAARKADEFILRTQPNGFTEEMASMFRDSNEFSKAFLQFQTSLNTIWNNITANVKGFAHNREYKEIIYTITGYALAGALLFLVQKGIDKDEDPKENAKNLVYGSLTQFIDSIPLLGGVLDGLMQNLITGSNDYNGTGFEMFPAVGKIIQGVESLSKGNTEGAKKVAEGLSIFIGLPTTGVKQAQKAIEEKDFGYILGK